jgi:hypothetical protein
MSVRARVLESRMSFASRPLKLALLLSGLAVVGVGCDQVPTDGNQPDGTTPVFHHRPGHAGGGGGDDGAGGPSYTLELSGAMVAAETPVEIGRDNKRALHVDGTMEVALAFDLSGASCTLVLPDGYAGDSAALEAYFRNILTGATGSPTTRNVSPLGVDKTDATGSIRLLPLEEFGDDRWVRLGDHPIVSGDFDGPGDRVLTYAGGTVRVVVRLSADSWEACSSSVSCNASDPASHFVCSGWAEPVVATLREVP